MRNRKPAPSRDPTAEELRTALEAARRILADPEQDWYPANTFKLAAEFELLGLETSADQRAALQHAANEARPEDYEPPEPPGLSDEPACRGTQMLPFDWSSIHFGSRMFFKFGLT